MTELNELDRALELAAKGVEHTELGSDVAMLGWCYLSLIKVMFARGDLASAEQTIKKMQDAAENANVPPWLMSQLASWQVRVWLALDDLDNAFQWIDARGLPMSEVPDYLLEMEYLAMARVLIAQRRVDEAIGLLVWLQESAEENGRLSSLIEILNLQAMAHHLSGDTDRAMAKLNHAIDIAKSSGFVFLFVNEGSVMGHLLYEALSRDIAPDYVQRLLNAIPVEKPDQVPPTQTQAHKAELFEPLTDREIEVLRLIAEGLSRQEIASQLVVSLNTVKAHARNIYGKLGVHSQMQAVGKARALEILDTE